MTFYKAILGFLTLLIFACFCFFPKRPSSDSEALYAFIHKSGKILGKKYGLRLATSGGKANDKIKELSIGFQKCCQPVTKEMGRKEIILLLNQLLIMANQDENLKPHLKCIRVTQFEC